MCLCDGDKISVKSFFIFYQFLSKGSTMINGFFISFIYKFVLDKQQIESLRYRILPRFLKYFVISYVTSKVL